MADATEPNSSDPAIPAAAVLPPAPIDGWDRAVEWLLVVLLAFAALALGVVHAWSEEVVFLLAAAITACLGCKLALRRDWRPAWTGCYVVAFLFLLLVCLQLLPLPAGLLGILSPNTQRLRTELLSDLPDAASLLSWGTLSIYPAATRHDLRIVSAAAVVFVAVVSVCRHPQQIRRLLTAVAAIGGAVALLALAQHATHAERIYWLIPTSPGARADGGPFINHSHFAQFMNLSVGCAIGMLLVLLQEMSRDRRHHSAAREGRLARILADPRARPMALLAVVIVAGLVAVAMSMSRGGVLSGIAAGAFTGLLLVLLRRREETPDGHARPIALAVVTLATFCVLLYTGFNTLYERFAARDTSALRSMDAGRFQMVRDMSQLWRQFPVAGTGLGTHEFVFPLVDSSTLAAVASHAENEFAQVFEETGVIGLLLVLAFATGVWVNFARLLHRRRSIHAAALGLGFGLIAVTVHSLSDFGQHLPANASLTAVVCGLIVALARLEPGRRERRRGASEPDDATAAAPERGWHSRVVRVRPTPRFVPTAFASLTGVMALLLLAMLPEADRSRRAEAFATAAGQMEANLAADAWTGTDEQYAALIGNAAEAARLRPDDVRYLYQLNFYRWQAVRRDVGPDGTLTAQAKGYADRVVAELNAARRACPTFGSLSTLAGQIELFVLDRPEQGAATRGYRLSPQDAMAALVHGRLEAKRGNAPTSLEALRRAAKLDGTLRTEVIGIYIHEVNPPRGDLALDLAGTEPEHLFHLEKEFGRNPATASLVKVARERAIESLKKRADALDNASGGELATLAATLQEDGDANGAAWYWRRALAAEIYQVEWRLKLVRALMQAGRDGDALIEARTCLRFRPDLPEARQLVEELEERVGSGTTPASQQTTLPMSRPTSQ